MDLITRKDAKILGSVLLIVTIAIAMLFVAILLRTHR